MADNNFTGVIESLMKGMNAVLGTKTVVGEATQIGDTIILPLIEVSFGRMRLRLPQRKPPPGEG